MLLVLFLCLSTEPSVQRFDQAKTADHHEHGAWSATGARSLVKRCAHFIFPLLSNGIAYFLSTRNNPYFSKISFSKLIPLPFGDQFWALSSSIQCTAIQPNFPGKIYLHTVATYSQHCNPLTIFTSRAVFAILRPISVALSRHQFWAVLTQLLAR